MQKVDLSGAPATLLITLYAKALDHRSRRPVLDDRKAAEIVEAIDYDFESLTGLGDSAVIAVRARHYDEWLGEFLGEHPGGTVLNLGCGLDTRVTRLSRSGFARWLDVDVPEVIELRRAFFSEGAGYELVAAPLTDPDPGWLARAPGRLPVAVVAEGVFEYMEAGEVEALLGRLTSHFDHGQVMFDCLSPFAVRSARAQLERQTGAVHRWAVDDLREVDALAGRLRRRDALSLFASPHARRLPWRSRLAFRAASLVPPFRGMLRLLRYEF